MCASRLCTGKVSSGRTVVPRPGPGHAHRRNRGIRQSPRRRLRRGPVRFLPTRRCARRTSDGGDAAASAGVLRQLRQGSDRRIWSTAMQYLETHPRAVLVDLRIGHAYRWLCVLCRNGPGADQQGEAKQARRHAPETAREFAGTEEERRRPRRAATEAQARLARPTASAAYEARRRSQPPPALRRSTARTGRAGAASATRRIGHPSTKAAKR